MKKNALLKSLLSLAAVLALLLCLGAAAMAETGSGDYVLDAALTAKAGSAYNITVTNLNQVPWWDLRILEKTYEGDWPDVWRKTSDDMTASAKTTFKVPASKLKADTRYRVSLWVNHNSEDPDDGELIEQDLYVYSAQSGDLTLKLNGGTAPITAKVRERVHFEVDAPGSVSLLKYNGNEFHWHGYDPECGGHFEWDEEMDPENRCYFVKVAYADSYDWSAMESGDFNWDEFHAETDVAWSDISNVVELDIECYGQADAARLKTAPTKVARGETMNLTIRSAGASNSPSRGRYFSVYFRDDERDYGEGGWNASDVDTPVDFTVYTAELPVGKYKLMVASGALGYTWNDTEYEFEVTQPQKATTIKVSDTEVYMDDELRYSVFASGDVDHLAVEWYSVDQRETFWRNDYGGDWAIGSHREGRSGQYLLKAIVYNAQNQEIDRQEQAVTIISRGDMAPAVITCDGAVNTTKALSFKVSNLAQEGMDWFDINIWDMDERDEEGNWPEIYRVNRDDAGDRVSADGTLTVTIPRNTLTPGHTYRIRVWVDGQGYNGRDSESSFVAYNKTDSNLTLTVNGSKTSATGLAHSDDFDIVATAKGAAAIRIFNGDHWDFWNDISTEGELSIWDYWFDTGVYDVVAQACYDEDVNWDEIHDYEDWNQKLNWSGISNRVKVTVTSEGPAQVPQLDQDGYTVTRGQLLRFQIINGGGAIGAPDSCTDYHAYIVDSDWNWDGGNDASLWGDRESDYPLSGVLCTGYLEPERSYWLVVDGCSSGYDWNSIQVPLTVVEPEDDFTFIVESDELVIDTDFTICAYAPGAAWMTVDVRQLDGDDEFQWGDWPGDFINGVRQRLGEGTWELTAVAHFTDDEGNEINTTRSDPVTVHVGFLGDMVAPTFVVSPPSPADASEAHIFGLKDLQPFGDNWYDIRVHDDNFEWPEGYEGDEDLNLVWRACPDETAEGTDNGVDDEGVHWFTIPKGTLIAGHGYSIDVWVDQHGYRGADAHTRFLAFDGKLDDSVSITINGGDHADVLSNQDATIRIEAPGATMVRFWNGDHWECRGDFDPERGVVEFGYAWGDLNTPTRTLFASATSEEIDFDTFDWNWESLSGWGGVSNQVTVTISGTGKVTGGLEVTPLNFNDIERGEMARVRINCTENVKVEDVGGNVVDVSIRNGNDEIVGDTFFRYHDVTFPFEVGIPTARVEPGDYHVVVSVCGLGCEWAETWTWEDQNDDYMWFTLKDASFDITFDVGMTELMVGEDFPISIYAPGADEVSFVLCFTKDGDAFNPVLENYFGGDRVSQSVSNWIVGEMRAYVLVRYPGDEDWTRSDPVDDIIMNFTKKGDMDPVKQQWTTVVKAGTAPRFKFEGVKNAEWYSVGVVDPDEGWMQKYFMDFRAETAPTDWVTLRNGETMESGKVYTVGVDAFGKGYGMSSTDGAYNVAVLPADATEMVLPKALKKIEAEAFAGVKADMIVIPEGVTAIGSRAFAGCPNLFVVVNLSGAELPEDAFQGCALEDRIFVTDVMPAE